MKTILILLLAVCPLFTFAQETQINVQDEINYFDGVNWVESVVLEINNDKYFIYTNRERTRKAWVSKSDIEPLYTNPEFITDFSVSSSLIFTTPVYHITDSVYYGQIKAEILNIVSDKITISTDSLAQNHIIVSEEDITLYSSKFPIEYTKIEKVKTYTFKLNDSVKYLEDGVMKTGKIEKINKEKKLFVNNKWMNYKEVEKTN